MIDQLDPSHPFDALFAEQAGREDAARVAVAHGQRRAIHAVRDERRGLERLLERVRIGVPVSTAEHDFRGSASRPSSEHYIAQRQTCPDRIAHEPSAEIVADAHERCFLRGGWQRANVVIGVRAWTIHQAADLQSPDRRVRVRIDNVLGHGVEAFVGCDWLDVVTAILGAVVAERGPLDELAQ